MPPALSTAWPAAPPPRRQPARPGRPPAGSRVGVRRPALAVAVVAAAAGRATLQASGELDITNAGLITGIVAAQLSRGRWALRLDLASVTFASCAAVRAILCMHIQCPARGTRLTHAGLQPPLAKVMRITCVDQVLRIADGTTSRDPCRLGYRPHPDPAEA